MTDVTTNTLDVAESTKTDCEENIVNTNSESDELVSQEKFKRHQIDPELRERLKDIPEAIDYIEKLERIIERQIKKILKWKNKFKQKKLKDIAIQTDANVTEAESKTLKERETASLPENAKSLADDIKEAAEMAMQKSGFVFEETSGMYYDYNTGYYYNAEYGLYYDGHTGTYLKYNQETEKYDFHSQVATVVETNNEKVIEAVPNVKPKRKKHKEEKSKEWKRLKKDNDDQSPERDFEEGECSNSSDSSDSDSDAEMVSDSSDVSKSWPPCMRVMVESSDNPKIKVASLHIVTCDGGTLGREGNHSILLPDMNVSKHHLKFVFDKEANKYLLTDLGSRNDVPEKIDKISMSAKHKNELKKLKKQCGLVGSNDDNIKLASGYTDRAQKRRETVGSQNPHEKTKMASVDESIPSENKGFKLLSKMGWKEGRSLGKTGEGIVEPINVVGNAGKTGIGAESVIPPSVSVNESKQNIWRKAQERFEKLPSHPTFELSEDDD